MKTRYLAWGCGGLALIAAAIIVSQPQVDETALQLDTSARQSHGESVPTPAAADQQQLREIRAMIAESDPQRRAEAVRVWLASVDPAQLPLILACLSEAELASDVAIFLLQHWAGKDPAAAAAWAASQPRASKPRMALMETVTAVWWEQDDQATADWLMTLRDPDEQIRLLTDLDYVRQPTDVPIRADDPAVLHEARQRAAKDVHAAAEWVVALPAGRDRVSAIKYLAAEWSSRDSRSAMAWAQSLTQPDDRRAALTAALVHLPIRCQAVGAE